MKENERLPLWAELTIAITGGGVVFLTTLNLFHFFYFSNLYWYLVTLSVIVILIVYIKSKFYPKEISPPDTILSKKKQNLSNWVIIKIGVIGGALLWIMIYFTVFAGYFISHIGEPYHYWHDEADYEPISIVEQGNVIYIDNGAFTIDRDTLKIEYNENFSFYRLTGVININNGGVITNLTFALLDEKNRVFGKADVEMPLLTDAMQEWNFRSRSIEGIDVQRVQGFKLRYVR